MYVSRLTAEANDNGTPSYKLKNDKKFSPTEKLNGDKGGLKEFFAEYGSQGKGLHVAIICSDDMNLDDAINVFSEKYLNCQEHNCDCCTVKRAIRISEIKNIKPELADGHKYYQEGCYWECISLPRQAQCNSILDAFQRIIQCMERLEKDSAKANEQLKAIQMIYNLFDDKNKNIGILLNDHYMSGLSDSILSNDDMTRECANIFILLFLPKAFYDIFKMDCLCFPHQIEYVIQGIESAKFYREYYDSPELQATRKFLTENYQNEKNKTPQEVALIVGETKDIDQIESGFPQCKFLRYTEKINSESIVPCEEITMESIDRENYKKSERE